MGFVVKARKILMLLSYDQKLEGDRSIPVYKIQTSLKYTNSSIPVYPTMQIQNGGKKIEGNVFELCVHN